MKIRSYLAILVLITLIGGYGVSHLISTKFTTFSAQSDSHVEALLWQKDLQRIKIDISQYLISADIVLGAGETYLAESTVKKGKLIEKSLTALASGNALLSQSSVDVISQLASRINKANIFVGKAALGLRNDDRRGTENLLKQYDDVTASVNENITQIYDDVDVIIELGAAQLEAAESEMSSYSLKLQSLFSIVVVATWYWASRSICLPLQRLRKDANLAVDGNRFNGVNSGPEEIKHLSDNFSNLTQSLSFQAEHDPLTKLYNRRAFGRAMTNIRHKPTKPHDSHTLCFIDLDHFKIINDTCGHAAGDELLVHVAEILTNGIRGNDVVARLGGDEFAILLEQCTIEKAKEIANGICDEIRNFEYSWEGEVFRIGASIGITEFDPHSSVVEDVLSAADIACMQSKELGRDIVSTFDSCTSLLDQKRRDGMSVSNIKSALQENRFELYRQDIVSLQRSSAGKHYEILLRMRDECGGLVSPGIFMPLVERNRLGVQVDRWVIRATINWLCDNEQEFDNLSMCSINLSGQSLSCPNTKEFIIDQLNSNKDLGCKICFEITETATIVDMDHANQLITELKKYGCRFALDDFGSGLSSFSYLKNLQVDYIKIDGVFVKDMLHNESDFATVRAINDVAQATGKETIAEFVEDAEIAKALRLLGINFGQGYYFDKPSPVEQDKNIEPEIALRA